MLVNLVALEELAKELASRSKQGDIFLLKGDLGSGKTSFARFFIKSLCPDEQEIVSPTFTLVQQYKTPNFIIWHLDLYRIETQEEIIELGLDDAYHDGVMLIEWPDIIEAQLPPHQTIHFEFTTDENIRELTLIPRSKN